MKKSIIFGGSILCLFILCSLSYQPMVAEEPIIETQIEDIPIKSDDCGCDKENKNIDDWDFPIICEWILVYSLMIAGALQSNFLVFIVFFLGRLFNCSWAGLNSFTM